MPMSAAQRQRKYRDKRRQEWEALRAGQAAANIDPTMLQELERLQAQLAAAAQTAARQQQRIEVLEAEQEMNQYQALCEAVRTFLPRLSPAAQHQARAHLQSRGLGAVLAVADAPPPPAPPTHLFF